MSPTCWPCSTTTWLSGNIHQHLIALVTTPPPTRNPHLPHPPVGPTSTLSFPGYWSPPLPLSPSSSVSSLHSDTACREVPASLQAALDRTQKKTCQLLLEELLLDLQVRLSPAPAAGRAAAKSASARPAPCYTPRHGLIPAQDPRDVPRGLLSSCRHLCQLGSQTSINRPQLTPCLSPASTTLYHWGRWLGPPNH